MDVGLETSPPAGGEVRKRRLSGAQRQQSIVDAAATVFAERGYEGARIEQIAAAAGVSKALIYEHFSGKRELYVHITSQGTRESLERVLEAAAEGKNSVQRMQRGLTAFLDYVSENPTTWRVIEQAVADSEIVAQDQSQQHRSERGIAQMLSADPEIKGRDVNPDNVELLAVMINGASVRAANWWIDHPHIPRDQVLTMMMKFMWLGIEHIRRGARNRAKSGNGGNNRTA